MQKTISRYLLAAQKMGLKPEECLVVEDAESGVKTGDATGCNWMQMLSTYYQL